MRSLYIFVFSLLSVSVLPGQNDPQHHHLTAEFASQHKVKSVKVVILFVTGKDSCVKYDTGSVDVQNYDISGKITSSLYVNRLDKNDYQSQSNYSYTTDGTLQSFVYKDGFTFDSTFHYDDFRFYELERYPNFTVLRELGGDSVLRETKMTKKDTTTHSQKYLSYHYVLPESGDYVLGNYRSKTVQGDPQQRSDTCDYFNTKGELIFRAVNFYDAGKNQEKTDLYNFGDKYARGFHARYNSKMNMSDWIPISKKGNSTYSITRDFSSLGLITEKRMFSTQKHFTPVIVRYVYEFYE